MHIAQRRMDHFFPFIKKPLKWIKHDTRTKMAKKGQKLRKIFKKISKRDNLYRDRTPDLSHVDTSLYPLHQPAFMGGRGFFVKYKLFKAF